jgi:hypothetical protein
MRRAPPPASTNSLRLAARTGGLKSKPNDQQDRDDGNEDRHQNTGAETHLVDERAQAVHPTTCPPSLIQIWLACEGT